MKLTRQQQKMLMALQTVIEVEWGIRIGYSCPMGSFTSPEDDYLVFEEPRNGQTTFFQSENDWEPSLYHRADVPIESESGLSTRECPQDFPLHDEEVEKFWARIQDALLSGELYHEPGFTRYFDYQGDRIEICCLLQANGCYRLDVTDNFRDTVRRSGKIRTLEQLKKDVETNQEANADPIRLAKFAEMSPEIQSFIKKEEFIEECCLQMAGLLPFRGKTQAAS